MFVEALKRLYYDECRKLEAMPIHEYESRLRLLRVRRGVLEEVRSALKGIAVEGRVDICDAIRLEMLREQGAEIEERFDESIDTELEAIDDEMSGQVDSARYTARDYADYLLQLERVYALERVLGEERLFADAVYQEMDAQDAGRARPRPAPPGTTAATSG